MAVPRTRCPLPFLLLLFLLPDPARGNEGGAAGSCRCRPVTSRPRFLENLESCDTCKHFTRFNFPRRQAVCGLNEDEWVKEVKSSHCQKGRLEEGAGKADASRGDRVPAPTSPVTVSTPTYPTSQRTVAGTTSPSSTSPRSTGVSSDKSQEMPQTTESHRETAWVPAMAESTPEASAEAATGEANKAPLEEKKAIPPSASSAKAPSIAVLCVVALLGGAAILVCWWRRRQRRWRQGGQRPQFPFEDKEEGTFCLPGENT